MADTKIIPFDVKGKFNAAIFSGNTINTPSLLVIEDALDALLWVQSIGGLPALIERSESCLSAIKRWVEESSTFGFLAETPPLFQIQA